MSDTELTLELRPHRGGAYTLVALRGAMATVAQPRELRSVLKVLSWWSGAPVDIALSADGTNAGSRWLEVWDDVLAQIRGAHLYKVRFVISGRTLAAEDGDGR